MPMVYNISTNLILWRQTMLTNNKKFVRGIAMLLAMLMVMAVALTGCGNKTADEALTKAEEAKTVADEVKAALADYLKTADAEAKVAALVDAALADGAATKAELEALAAQLDSYVTADDVAALITDAVANAALEGAMTKDDVLEILKDYYTKEDIDNKLENYFGEFEPEQVLAILTDADKAMNEADWDEATPVVVDTIKTIQTLLTQIQSHHYTQANMKKINEALAPLGIVAFKAAAGTTKLTSAIDGDVVAKLQVAILRVPSLEKLNALKAAVDAAAAVPSFETEYAALTAQLYAMGEDVAFGDYTGANGAFVPSKGKYTSYHGKTYGANDVNVAQVVTLKDKAAFYAWNEALDSLFVTYMNDGYTNASISAIPAGLAVVDVLTKTQAGVTTLMTVAAGTAPATGFVKVGQSVVTDATGAAYLKNKFGVAAYDATQVYALPTAVVNYATVLNEVETDWKTTGKYGYAGNTTVSSDATLTGNAVLNAYGAIYAQLVECQTAANEANTIFDNFQHDTIWAGTALSTVVWDYSKVTGDNLLAYLTASMCENDGVSTYPAGYIFLTDVTTEMDQSYALNGKNEVGINEYPLYLAMLDKAYDLLWDKYLAKAFDDAETILNDYLSVLYMIEKEGLTDASAIFAGSDAASAEGWMAAEGIVAGDLTVDFLKAFMQGDAVTLAADSVYKRIGHSFNNIHVNQMLATNGLLTTNGAPYFAYVANSTAAGAEAGAVAYLTAQPFAWYDAQQKAIVASRLAGAMTYTSTQIVAANKDDMKAKGVPVQEAFNTILAEAVTNMEEIYMRLMLPAYKNATVNELYAYATSIINFYATGTNGANAEITKAMEQYVTGYATTGVTGWADALGAEVAYNKVNNANSTIKSVSYTENSATKNYAGASLTNKQVLTAMDGVTANLYATSDISGTAPVGAEAWAKVDGYKADAVEVMENVIVANQFYYYIQQARVDWANVNGKYFDAVADKTNYELLVAVSLQNSTVNDTLNNIEFFARYNKYDLMDYKAQYLEILQIVAGKDNTHLALLKAPITDLVGNGSVIATKTTEAYNGMLANVKSAMTLPAGATWVNEPVRPLAVTTAAPWVYSYVGTSVVGIDEILNANASYIQNGATVKLY